MVVSLQTLVFAVATLSLQEVYSAYKLIFFLVNHAGERIQLQCVLTTSEILITPATRTAGSGYSIL